MTNDHVTCARSMNVRRLEQRLNRRKRYKLVTIISEKGNRPIF